MISNFDLQQPTYQPGLCIDKDDQCPEYLKRPEGCGAPGVPENCQKSCEVCTQVPTPAPTRTGEWTAKSTGKNHTGECIDLETDPATCASYKLKGYCDKPGLANATRLKCPHTCGECTALVLTNSTVFITMQGRYRDWTAREDIHSQVLIQNIRTSLSIPDKSDISLFTKLKSARRRQPAAEYIDAEIVVPDSVHLRPGTKSQQQSKTLVHVLVCRGHARACHGCHGTPWHAI